MDDKQFEAIKKLFEKKKKLLDTTEVVHAKAYVEAAEKHLMDDHKQIDYTKLQDIKTQKDFSDTMTKHYLAAAKKALGVTETKGVMEDEMLLSAYIGVTSDFLRNEISEKRHTYTVTAHSDTGHRLKDAQDKKLYPVLYKDLGHAHIDDIIRYTRTQDVVDSSKMSLQEATGLLNAYFANGYINPNFAVGTHYAKKKAAGGGHH